VGTERKDGLKKKKMKKKGNERPSASHVDQGLKGNFGLL
jgi:hypothetical protein